MIQNIKELNFPEYATLSSATVTLNDMGDRTISTQIKILGDIIPDFSYDWEVEFKGERYIQPLRQPQASKGNESMSSTIDLTFYHKTIWQLKRYYFVEMTSTESGTAIADRYIASLGLNLYDFCVAFQKVLDYYFDGAITIDLNPNLDYTKGVQFMGISYSYIWDVLQKMYEVYGVRWTIEGNAIKVGYPSTILSHTFQYGYEGGLLQVERQVQDANIRNSLLGRGGEQNLPAYYFKEAPEGSLFASDPDAIPELANIYFSNLRGKTFRDYVKGWKAKHYGGSAMSNPSEAYTRGYTDSKFSPIEYVEDKESIEKYGLLQGALENNEEIYPSIQGAPNGEDVVVYVEPVLSDDVEGSIDQTTTIALKGMSQVRPITLADEGNTFNISLQSDTFEVPEDSYALTIGNNAEYKVVVWGAEMNSYNVLVNVTEQVVNVSTNKVVDKSSLPKGFYKVITTFSGKIPFSGDTVSGIGENRTFGVSTSLELRKLQNGTTDKWLPTFNIWVKNIWGSTRNSGENDLEYAERVWRPILGDRQGNEAKVVFSSGWLSGHEDYEFTIVDFAYDNSKSYSGSKSEWRLTLAKSDAELDATGRYIPSASTNGQAYAGDTFFFIGIDMPHQYVLWAEERLDNYKTASLNEVSEIQPKWVVRLDKLRLHEGEDNLAEQIEVGGAINLADVRFIDAPALQLYLQSVTYTWNEQTLLYPDIEVVLADTIVPVQNPISKLQGSIDAINSQLYNIGNVENTVRKIGDRLYLRKDGIADISQSPTRFTENISGYNFRQGTIGGADWGIYRDENGNAIAEFDKVIVRNDLEVNNLVINQVSYEGGMQITSAASLVVSRVVENDNDYQCFFDTKSGTVANLFQIDDIAYSQRFDNENTAIKSYKRVVVGVGIDFISLSKNDADGDGIPMDNDIIIQYGNITDSNRQYVIIRDVIGGGYERMLSDLNSVSAEGVEYYFAGRMDGETPRWFVGNKEQQFIEYKDGHLQINADVTLGANSILSESREFQEVRETADNAVAASKSYTDQVIKDLQDQIDGKVESHYYDYDPTTTNAPASEWTTDELKSEHLNDTFTNTDSGRSWRWLLKDGVYQWVEISDTQASEALAKAQEALGIANGKVTIFVTKPKSPYKEKDIWLQGEDGRIKRCVTTRTTTGEFYANDWVNADDSHEYADDKANEAEDNANKYTDGQISKYNETIKYLKDAFPSGAILDVNGVTLAALVGVKDENNSVVAGLYGGANDTLNSAGYADATHGAMLLFGGIEGVDKPKTYKTAIFEDGYIESTMFATGRSGRRIEIFGNELNVYGDDARQSVLRISYDEAGKPYLGYYDISTGEDRWYLSESGISTSYSVTEIDKMMANLVDKSTAQTVTGIKDFANGLKVGGVSVTYNAAKNAFVLPANLLVEGGIAWNSKIDGFDVPTIMDAIQVDGETISKDKGYLEFVGQTSGGGTADSVAWENVTGRPTKLSQFTDDVVTGNYLPINGTAVNSSKLLGVGLANGNGRNGIPTLSEAGYMEFGMAMDFHRYDDGADFSTRLRVANGNFGNIVWLPTSDGTIALTSDITNALASYVTIGTAQNITGVKNFINGLKIGGTHVTYNASKNAFVFPANAIFEGGVAWNASIDGFTPQTIMDAIIVDDDTISKANGYLEFIGETGGLDETELANYLTTNNYAKKSDIPSLSGYATQSWVTNKGYITGITSSMVTTALGYTPYNAANFTKANIKSTLGISDWALASVKPSYAWTEIISRPTNVSAFTNDSNYVVSTGPVSLTSTLTAASVICATGKLRVNASDSVNNFGYIKAVTYSSNRGLVHIGSNYGGRSDITNDGADVDAIGIYRGCVGIGRTFTGDELYANQSSGIALQVAGHLKVDGANLSLGGKTITYDATENAFIFPANILAEGGVAWNTKLEGFDQQTVTAAVSVDGTTITKTTSGALQLNPSIEARIAALEALMANS